MDALDILNFFRVMRQNNFGGRLGSILSTRFSFCFSHYSVIVTISSCCTWSHELRPNKLSVSVAVPPAPVRVPSQRPLAPSVASVTSVANDKGDNEMILGLCTDLLAFALQPRKTTENLSQEVIASNGVPFLQMRSVGLHSTSGRETEGIKEWTEWESYNIFHSYPSLISSRCLWSTSNHCPQKSHFGRFRSFLILLREHLIFISLNQDLERYYSVEIY